MTKTEYRMPVNSGYNSEKPNSREKALNYGIESLTDIELIMLLLGNGQKKVPVQKLAEKVLNILHTSSSDTIQKNLLSLYGMGPKKTTSIIGALECGKGFILWKKATSQSCTSVFYGL